MNSTEQLETIPLRRLSGGMNLLVRDVATVKKGTMSGQYDRNTMQRYLSLTANVEGETSGARASNQRCHHRRGAAAKRRSNRYTGADFADARNVQVYGHRFGDCCDHNHDLVNGVFRIAPVGTSRRKCCARSISGIALALWLTGTSLNIESFMGSIMCIGVSLSNSVMMVSFIARDWHHGKPPFEAAWLGAGTTSPDSYDRVRNDGGHGSNGPRLGAW